MDHFIDRHPSLETYWRSIILLGANVASYKFALAKSLLEIPHKNSLIKIEDLALPFAKNVSEHLATNDKQITSSSSRFLDFCRQFNKGNITEEDLRKHSSQLGFVNVIDAFHNVAHSEIPRFFQDNRRTDGGILLTDNFYKLIESSQNHNLKFEVNSRWRLWETALSLGISSKLLEVHSDTDTDTLFVVNDKFRRIDVTSSRDALNGYQKGKCFYCYKEIQIEQGFENSCDVDHFFPHMLKNFKFNNVDQVWNLVLSCKDCNRGTGGKLQQIPDIGYLDALNKRNTWYIQSHHPLRETILAQTGKTVKKRRSFLQFFFDRAVDTIPSRQKWEPKEIWGDKF